MNLPRNNTITPSVRSSWVYITSILIVSSCAILLLSFFYTFQRADFISLILSKLQRPYLANRLQNEMLSEKRFKTLHQFLLVLIILLIIATSLLIYYRNSILQVLNRTWASVIQMIRSCWLNLTNGNRLQNKILVFFFSFVLLRALYYIFTTNLQYDEIWCYNYYTSRPFYLNLFNFSTYPFYELSTHLFNLLPFPDKINLRLPGLLSGIATTSIIYSCIKKLSGHFLTAILCAALFVTTPFASNYMLYGRGNMLEILCAVISLFSTIFYLKTPQQKKYLTLLMLATAAGIFAMPTHIYFWAPLFVFSLLLIIQFRRGSIIAFVTANLAGILLALFLWAPILIGSGLSIIGNKTGGNYYQLKSIESQINLLKDISNIYSHGNLELPVLILLSGVVLMFARPLNRAYLFIYFYGIITYLTGLLVYHIQHIAIPDRSLAFTVICVPLFFFIIFIIIKDWLSNTVLWVTASLLFAISTILTHAHPFRFWSAAYDSNAIDVADVLILNKATKGYDNAPASKSYYYYPSLEYYLRKKHLELNLSTAAMKSLRYKPFDVSDQYDFILDSLNADSYLYRNRYQKAYTSQQGRFNIWLRKSP